MRHYAPMRTGDEYDALTRWRRFLHWRAGERAKVKRLYRRRERRVLQGIVREAANDALETWAGVMGNLHPYPYATLRRGTWEPWYE